MAETTPHLLTKFEWVEHPVAHVRMKFRRDSTGFYERENAPGMRFIHENFLYRIEEGLLHLKFAHAREWAEFKASWTQGKAGEDARIGRWQVEIDRDPYAWKMEEKETPALLLYSDSGAALLG